MNRRTLVRAVSRSGIGVHTGEPAEITLAPAPFGTGIRFVTERGEIPATLAHARAEPGCTVLSAGSARVLTPEHLLAAVAALGLTDVRIALRGPEVPAMDGSAGPWVDAIDEAGRADGPALIPFSPSAEARVDGFGGWATLGPGASLSVEVAFDGGPTGTLRVPATEDAFRTEIAWARTFVRAVDVERLRAAGRGRGATAENTVVWPGSALRSADEPVRHKLLDAWGDLALLGPCRVALHVVRGSHALHHAVLSACG